MSSAKFNVRNPAVKRILQEIKELQSESSPDFIADALEEDIFEWHFVIRGPPDTEFEGGIFHGRILLPSDYPFKPPAFMMLTPNGRFQTGVKICLSISSHHPEHWQPSWSVRTALTALIAFMPTPGQGALGSLDFTKDERRQLAAKSVTDVPKFGSAGRQKVIDDMHGRFLELQRAAAAAKREAAGAAEAGGAAAAAVAAAGAAAGLAAAARVSDTDDASPARAAADQGATRSSSAAAHQQPQQQLQQRDVFSLAGSAQKQEAEAQHPQQQQQQQQSPQPAERGQAAAGQQQQQPQFAAAGGAAHSPAHAHAKGSAASSPTSAAAMQHPAQGAAAALAAAAPLQQQRQLAAAAGLGTVPGEVPGDRGLTFLAVVLAVAIAAMLLKKVIVAIGGDVRPVL